MTLRFSVLAPLLLAAPLAAGPRADARPLFERAVATFHTGDVRAARTQIAAAVVADPAWPLALAMQGRIALATRDGALAEAKLRALADAADWRVEEAMGDDVPWLIVACGAAGEEGTPAQGAPQVLLCAEASLHQLDPSGNAAGFHALPPLNAGGLVELTRGTTTTELTVERAEAFFGALGQTSAPIGSGRLMSFYSSSQAIDVVARCLQETVETVGVVSPSLDCVPALLRARRLKVVAVSEEALTAPDPLAEVAGSPGALFIASPNNPTGLHLDPPALTALACACAERSVVLVIDQCFRAFDSRTHYDSYACLDATGVEYVVIEDTGKLWPVCGLKLGFLCTSVGTRLPVAEAMAATAADTTVIFVPAKFTRGAVVELTEPSATRIWGRLLQRGVHTVPCRPFYWAEPDVGERYLRVALSRDPEDVESAAAAIREVVAATVRA